MKHLLHLTCGILVLPAIAEAGGLALSAYPKLPHAVRDACRVGRDLYFISEKGLHQAVAAEGRWEIREILRTGPAETLWALDCNDLLPAKGPELVVSRVRAGVWRSLVMTHAEGGWTVTIDDLPFALRFTRWQGQDLWIGDARFPQAGDGPGAGRGEFFLIDTGGSTIKPGKKIRLPRGSVLHNWVELPGGDIAQLRSHRMKIYTGGPRWRLKQHLPGGGMTTLCAESQPPVMSATGEISCRQMAPTVWNSLLFVPRNILLADAVVGRVPMIEHAEMVAYVRDPALDAYQTAAIQGPLSGELPAYFIDKNPADGRDTLFLVLQMRTAAEAVGGLTKYSLLVPVALDALMPSQTGGVRGRAGPPRL